MTATRSVHNGHNRKMQGPAFYPPGELTEFRMYRFINHGAFCDFPFLAPMVSHPGGLLFAEHSITFDLELPDFERQALDTEYEPTQETLQLDVATLVEVVRQTYGQSEFCLIIQVSPAEEISNLELSLKTHPSFTEIELVRDDQGRYTRWDREQDVHFAFSPAEVHLVATMRAAFGPVVQRYCQLLPRQP